MVDTVNVSTVHKGARRITYHMTNESDGSGESVVAKVDLSGLTYPVFGGAEATFFVVERIEYSVAGFNYVTLEWDHDTNDEIAVLIGQGVIDWTPEGGLVDPQTTGGTGDIVLTTDGAIDGASYDISLWLRPKA